MPGDGGIKSAFCPGHDHRARERMREHVESEYGRRSIFIDAEGLDIERMNDYEVPVFSVPDRRSSANELSETCIVLDLECARRQLRAI